MNTLLVKTWTPEGAYFWTMSIWTASEGKQFIERHLVPMAKMNMVLRLEWAIVEDEMGPSKFPMAHKVLDSGCVGFGTEGECFKDS